MFDDGPDIEAAKKLAEIQKQFWDGKISEEELDAKISEVDANRE